MSHSLLRATLALALAALTACDNGTATASRSADPGFAGHWTSPQWGEHYILVDGTTIKVVYTHDNGRVLGTLDGTKITGWWTETPSRQPTADAGEVTFTLVGTGNQRTIDGVWSYGTGQKRENWDLTYVDATIPDTVKAQFDDGTGFSSHP